MKLRTKLLCMLLLGASLFFFGVQNASWSDTIPLDNSKFLSVGKIIGTEEGKARELLGQPSSEDPESCGTITYPTIGTLWFYESSTDTAMIELYVCVYKGFVVGQEKTLKSIDAGVLSTFEEEYVAVELIQHLILQTSETPELPSFDGPEVEI